MKVIVVGRHAPDFGSADFQVLETQAVTFPGTSVECSTVLDELLTYAKERNAALLFQAVPGQLVAALRNSSKDLSNVGIVVSIPGERPGKVTKRFDAALSVEEAVKFANPRAVCVASGGSIEVSVDGPPMTFVFSHIEWLD